MHSAIYKVNYYISGLCGYQLFNMTWNIATALMFFPASYTHGTLVEGNKNYIQSRKYTNLIAWRSWRCWESELRDLPVDEFQWFSWWHVSACARSHSRMGSTTVWYCQRSTTSDAPVLVTKHYSYQLNSWKWMSGRDVISGC